MLNLSHIVDLPLVWGGLIATAVLVYVLLDGFDLGVGILFPFAPSEKCRDRMMNSIVPFWDANETWLVLGGGGLFAAFPLAYSIIMPAFYIPIISMLLFLVMRGVAFEFRFKTSDKNRYIWNAVFHIGSLGAALFQGMIFGGFVQGIHIEGRSFAGGAFDWFSIFSVMMGIAMIFGYSLLGSTWLIMKTQDITQAWARNIASYASAIVAVFIFFAGFAIFGNQQIIDFAFFKPSSYCLFGVAVILASMFLILKYDLSNKKRECRPFFLVAGICTSVYLAFACAMFPWIIPFGYDIWEVAAAPESLSLMLVGVAPLLPTILGYSFYCYYVFRGKAGHEKMY